MSKVGHMLRKRYPRIGTQVSLRRGPGHHVSATASHSYPERCLPSPEGTAVGQGPPEADYCQGDAAEM